MTIPRLADAGAAEARRLLHAARTDGPSMQLHAQVLLSVGLDPTAASAASTGFESPSLGPIGAKGLASSVGTSKLGFAIVVKWVGIAAVALLGGTGAGLVVGSSWAAKAKPAVVTSPDGRPTGESFTSPRAATVAAVGHSPSSVHVTVKETAPSPRTAKSPTHRLQGDALAEEIRLVDASRAALRSGEPLRSLQLLQERHQKFPKGVLAPEAALLRIEALTVSGQRDAAAREGNVFLARHPTGPLASRIRTLLQQEVLVTTAAPGHLPSRGLGEESSRRAMQPTRTRSRQGDMASDRQVEAIDAPDEAETL